MVKLWIFVTDPSPFTGRISALDKASAIIPLLNIHDRFVFMTDSTPILRENERIVFILTIDDRKEAYR
jgi:hypothetical protein